MTFGFSIVVSTSPAIFGLPPQPFKRRKPGLYLSGYEFRVVVPNVDFLPHGVNRKAHAILLFDSHA